MAGIRIKWLSDDADAIRGSKAVKDSIEDVADATDDVTKEFRDAAREAGWSSEKIESALEDIAREADKTGRGIGNDLDDGFDKAKRSADDFDRDASGNIRNFKQEAVQNLSEVASSWKGDVQGMADGVQGLSGGLAASLTPGIGIPVAILGAAAAAFFASWVKSAEQSEERVRGMYEDFAESGASFVSESYIGKAIDEIVASTDRWNDAQKINRDTGIEIGEVLRAMAGDQSAIATVHAEYVRQRDEEVQKIRDSGKSLEDQAVAVDAANAKFGEQSEWIGQIQRDTGSAADKAAAYRDAMGGAADNASKVRDIVGQIQDRSITIGVNVSNAGFESYWRTLQNRAAQGITVNVRPGAGRFWE